MRSLLVLAVPLAATHVSAGQSVAALEPRSLLDVAIAPAAHLRLRLHVGEYQIRASQDGHIHIFETQKEGSEAPGKTEVRFHQTATGGRLEIEPPMGKRSPHITIALPPCSALDLALSVGQLVFDAVPCEATNVNLHIGELRAALGDAASYGTTKASVSIGEVDARGLGEGHADEQHGGFFRNFEHKGVGTRTFAASVGSGQITLDTRRE